MFWIKSKTAKEHVEEALDGVEERIDESELEADNLVAVDEEELENDLDEDDFYTNILDEEDMPDDKIFKDLDGIEE